MALTRSKNKLQSERSRDRLQRPSQSPTRRWKGTGPFVLVGILFLLHSLGLLLLFDPITGFIDNQPVIEQDWGLHFHHIKSMEEFWRQHRSLWGYNPFFMAGYPSNTIQDLSIKLFEILSLLLSSLGLKLVQAFKLSVFMTTACVPWMLFFAARNFFDEEISVATVSPVAALLGTAYWWNSLPREMFFYGMVGFPVSSNFALLTLSLLYQVFRSERTLSSLHWAWLLAATAILPLHFQAVLILAPAALALLITHRGSLSRKSLLWLVAGAVASLLANLIWLLPAWTHRGDNASSAIVAQLPIFVSSDPLTFLKDYLRPAGYWTFRASFWENGLRWMLLILGLTGMVKLIRTREQRNLGIVMACGVSALFLLAYFGSLIPSLKSLQPLRFKVPYDLFLVLTSSYLIGLWRRSSSSNSRSTWIPVLLACGLITVLINLIQTESKNTMRLRTQISPEVKELVEWVRNETPIDGRVLFEESGDETGFVYEGTYLSSFLPYWTGRQLIGGPINLYNDRHHFAEFHSGMLFKRDILSLTDEELYNYFRMYNIGAVVAFHPRSIQRLRSSYLVSLDRRVGDIHLMTVKLPLSWFLKGNGDLKVGLNMLKASGVSGDEVILKYHWVKGLVSKPAVRIAPQKFLDDPIPFIKVINPPPEFTLQIGQ